jgi:hypothetical protein
MNTAMKYALPAGGAAGTKAIWVGRILSALAIAFFVMVPVGGDVPGETSRECGSQASTRPQSHVLPSSPRSYQRPPMHGSMTASTAVTLHR